LPGGRDRSCTSLRGCFGTPTRRAVTFFVLPKKVTKESRACEGGRLRRLRCAAQAGVAPRNSLRSLRELRSDRRGESEVEARSRADPSLPLLAAFEGTDGVAAHRPRKTKVPSFALVVQCRTAVYA
jgi:hypothetical protein